MEASKEKTLCDFEPMSIKPIKVENATCSIHMQLAYKAVQVFKDWEYREFITDGRESMPMKIIGSTKHLFKKNHTWEIFTYETPIEFIVKLKMIA